MRLSMKERKKATAIVAARYQRCRKNGQWILKSIDMHVPFPDNDCRGDLTARK